MHVVIATGLYPPEIGGPATFSAFFERELRARGIPCVVIPFSSVRFLPKILRHGAYAFVVLRALRRDSIVFALDPVSVGLPALIAARARGKKFFLRVGGDYAWEQATQRWRFDGLPEEFSPRSVGFAGKVLTRVQALVARRAEKVLVQSSYLASLVERWRVEKGRIVIVPNGMSPIHLPSREVLRAEFGWGEEPVVVSAGRLVPWKGFPAVIRAAGRAGARLFIAGEGPDEAALRTLAARSEGRAELLGSVPRERLMRLIAAADAFVLNTRYEGFSHQILEAMSVGTPVVTTDIPGNADMVESGITALAVSWNEEEALAAALKKIITEKDFASRLSARAREKSSEFTHERTFFETARALGITV